MKLSPWRNIGLGAWMLLAAACGGTDGSKPDGGTPPDRFQPLVQAVQQELLSSGVPGAAIAVVEKGKVTFAQGFGTKTPGQSDLVKPTTLFRIGSLTKAFTAIGLLQTVHDGQVDLDKPLVEYVPNFQLTRSPDLVPQITVRHLLTHTSGLFDYLEDDVPAEEKTDDALESFLTGRYTNIGYIQSPPGAFYAYANPGFMLAGLIAQKATGTVYRQLLHERVFERLEMHRTFFLPSEVLADGDYANAYQTCVGTIVSCPWPDGIVHPDSYDNAWGRPAGYAWSSVLDMAQLAAFLVHGRDEVLAKDLWTAMTSPQAVDPMSGGTASYGFGMVVTQGLSLSSDYYSLKTVWHNGGIPGYSAFLSCIPDLDFCFISLANGDGAFFPHSREVAIRTLVDLPAPTAPPDLTPQPQRYALYVGTYIDRFSLGKIEITTDSGKLFISNDSSGSAELKPTILDNFTFKFGDATMPLTFIAGPEGGYTYIYSRPYVAVRTATP